MAEAATVPPMIPTPVEVKGIRKLWYKDGQFSKTAVFAVAGNICVLINYMLMSWLTGAAVDLGFIKFTVPGFNIGDAAALLAILNGTYIGNNLLKNKKAADAAEAAA